MEKAKETMQDAPNMKNNTSYYNHSEREEVLQINFASYMSHEQFSLLLFGIVFVI